MHRLFPACLDWVGTANVRSGRKRRGAWLSHRPVHTIDARPAYGRRANVATIVRLMSRCQQPFRRLEDHESGHVSQPSGVPPRFVRGTALAGPGSEACDGGRLGGILNPSLSGGITGRPARHRARAWGIGPCEGRTNVVWDLARRRRCRRRTRRRIGRRTRTRTDCACRFRGGQRSLSRSGYPITVVTNRELAGILGVVRWRGGQV